MRAMKIWDDDFVLSAKYDRRELNQFMNTISDLPMYIQSEIYDKLVDNAIKNEGFKILRRIQDELVPLIVGREFCEASEQFIVDTCNQIISNLYPSAYEVRLTRNYMHYESYIIEISSNFSRHKFCLNIGV